MTRRRRGGEDQPREKKVRPPPLLTSAYLHDQARRHLLRYWPSVSQMRRVLRRRVDRCIRFHGGDRDEGHALVETVLTELIDSGRLDDARFTRGWLDTLHRRGSSRRLIRQRLRQKGVDPDLIDQLLAAHDATLQEEGNDPELARAVAYCRRRRLGPLRHPPSERAARRERDLAAMARAGFPFGLALRCIDADDLDALEEEWP